MRTKRVRVTLNGTAENPYSCLGLTQNPFKRAALSDVPGWAADLLAELEARPIASHADLAQRLEGCSPEFRDLCLRQFTIGKIKTFYVTWQEED